MIEISLNKINKSYGFNPILKDFSFEIKSGERIALIGPNGCGKTTTLRIIMGEDIDSGSINIRKSAIIQIAAYNFGKLTRFIVRFYEFGLLLLHGKCFT